MKKIMTFEHARYAAYELTLFMERWDPRDLYDWHENMNGVNVALREMQKSSKKGELKERGF